MYKELTIYSTSSRSLLQRDMFPASYMCRFISDFGADFGAAIVDALKSAILTALLCIHPWLHSFLPHRWPGILNVSLGCKFLCWSRTVTPFQSTPWPAFYACSAITDVLKSAILTALLCSSILLHSFLPHRWPGILHTGYSRLHLISPCLGSPPHMVSTCESLYSLRVSNCKLGKN